jgi:LuxR family transcriptional regulator, maltose regulon positive regulatory protein
VLSPFEAVVSTRSSAAAPRPLAPRRRAGRRSLEVARDTPPFDFLESRIQVPSLRPGTVSRTALVNQLRAATSARVATVVAPAGYGKTTLLSQWAERDPRKFSWVTVDDRDNDPVVLLRHIAAALDGDEPLEPRVIQALQSPGPSIWAAAVPRVAAALAARGPLVLVLDDFNLLRSRTSLETVAALIDDEAEGSTLVVAGRVPPRLPLAPLRASGRLLELGPAELALSRREAQLLLRSTGVPLGESRTQELIEQCEGWAAALYLATLSIRDGRQRGRGPAPFGGDDRYLADYFRSEYLSCLRPGPLRFLRRTSVLERMSGPLCDAVLEDEGSARELERIERANLFLVPLDNRREWYRYHHLFHELLRRELAETEPELVPVLHSRAADWYEAEGDDESALEHAYAAGDTDRAAAILAAIAFPVYYSGRVATLERWLKRFESPGLLERYPAVALHGCRIHVLRGRAEQAERWLEAAKRGTFTGALPDGSPSIRPWIAVLRAWLCRAGANQMLADARAALAELAEGSNWRPSALLAQGSALMLLGRDEQAAEILDSAATSAEACGSTETRVVALGERALLAAEQEDHVLADGLSQEANRLVTTCGVEGYAARTVEHSATARTMLRHGRWNEARAALTAARALIPHLTIAIPWLAVQTRIELARGFVTLRDGEAAQELLDEIEEIACSLPDLGALGTRAQELQKEVDGIPEPEGAQAVGLTPAELRLLPLLSTHLSFREIAEQLYLSRNTIKTQAISLYRKLGVSSRSEAIAEAHRLGLGERLRVLIGDNG